MRDESQTKSILDVWSSVLCSLQDCIAINLLLQKMSTFSFHVFCDGPSWNVDDKCSPCSKDYSLVFSFLIELVSLQWPLCIVSLISIAQKPVYIIGIKGKPMLSVSPMFARGDYKHLVVINAHYKHCFLHCELGNSMQVDILRVG